MERLSRAIETKVKDKSWKSVLISNSGPKVLYLFFADDLALFYNASPEDSQSIINTLNVFCDQSGKRLTFASQNASFSQIVIPIWPIPAPQSLTSSLVPLLENT